MSEVSLLLIVFQKPRPAPGLAELAEELRGKFALDPYTVRQQLLGIGLAQLASGRRADLEEIGTVVRRHGYDCRVVPQPVPAFEPLTLRGLRVDADAVEFYCAGERTLRLEKGQSAVGILADISGQLGERQATSLLNRTAYLGAAATVLFTPAEARQAVLKGTPVFDCYLLDGAGGVKGAFRARPGGFEPSGLGPRGGPAALRNLAALVDLPGEFTSAYTLHCDFGLSPVPGCRPQPTGDDPNRGQDNLDELTRYGWLAASLAGPATTLQVPPSSAAQEIAANSPADIGEWTDEEPTRAGSGRDEPSLGKPLPVPPEPPPRPLFRRRSGVALAIFAATLSLALLTGDTHVPPLLRRGVASGLIPGLAALVCLGGAAWMLLVQRRIEDTPTSRIRSLAMGLVEVRGRALRCYALVAPMTQTPCVWYRLRRYRRDSGSHWRLTTEIDSSHVPFILDDGTGLVMVAPAGAAVRAATGQSGYDSDSEEKWSEESVAEGSSLYVLGRARWPVTADTDLGRRTIAALRRLKLDPSARQRYDADGDGQLDAGEWEAARDDIGRRVATEQLKATVGPALATIGRAQRGTPFLIAATRTDRELLARYRGMAVFLLLAGLAAAGVALSFVFAGSR